MMEILNGSKLVSFVLKLVSVFVCAYDNSKLKRFLSGLNDCFNKSITRKILASYAHKKPWFRYSLTYKLIMFIVKIADVIFGFIYKICKKCIFGSRLELVIKKGKSMALTDKCYIAGVLLVSIPIGAMLSSIIMNNCDVIIIVISWAVFVVGIMVVLVGIYGRDSIIVKLIKGLIEAVK